MRSLVVGRGDGLFCWPHDLISFIILLLISASLLLILASLLLIPVSKSGGTQRAHNLMSSINFLSGNSIDIFSSISSPTS